MKNLNSLAIILVNYFETMIKQHPKIVCPVCTYRMLKIWNDLLKYAMSDLIISEQIVDWRSVNCVFSTVNSERNLA